ncbi:MAG TPA: ATP-binding protein [Candidatus Nanoarchaeia archaeon]|nr:ATP-binding protein [Candidatus Nanoarchaeia archaeon]
MTEKPKARPYADIKNPFTVDQGGAFAEYYLRDPDLMPDLGLGSRILVYDKRDNKDVWITATVVGLKAVSPFDPERQNLLYIEDESQDPTRLLTTLNGPHSHQPLLIKARLEREMTIVEEDGTKKIYSSAIQRPPSSSSNMRFPDILPINGSNEPCLQEMLDIKEKGISLGAIGFGNHPYEQDNKFLFYKWDLDNLDNKHIFIVGESGSGKTVLLKNLALQIREHDPDMRIIMTDIQGDLAQLIVPSVISERKVEGWQSKIKRDKIEDSLKKIGPFQIIIPVSKESGSSPNIIALKKLAVKNSVQVREIGLRLQDLSYPSEVEYLYRVQSEQVASLLDEEAEEIRRQSNPVTVARLRESITNLLTQTRGGQINSHGGTPYYPTTGYAAQRALRNLSNYFDHHQQSMGL